jgi:hypothetical protein
VGVRRALILLFACAFLWMTSPTAIAVVSTRPDPTWQTNGRVDAVLYWAGRIYLGGAFTELRSPDGSQVVTRRNIAAIVAATGDVDLGFVPEADGAVYALAANDNGVFVGGAFRNIGGQPRAKLAAVDAADGSALAAWRANANGNVEGVAIAGSRLYVGGNFTALDGQLRSYLAAVDAASGDVDGTWTPTPSARVRTVVAADAIYAGGQFTTVDGVRQRRLARLDPLTGAPSRRFNSDPGGEVWGLSATSSRVYAAIGGGGGACASFDAASGATSWSIPTNGNAQSVTLLNGLAYCGGHFGGAGAFGGRTRYKLAAADATTGSISAFAPRINSAPGVLTLTTDANRQLYAGGAFTRVTGVHQQGIARFTDSD